ncbi:unnamed protein product, partial [Mesorhabditis spiculigera]
MEAGESYSAASSSTQFLGFVPPAGFAGPGQGSEFHRTTTMPGSVQDNRKHMLAPIGDSQMLGFDPSAMLLDHSGQLANAHLPPVMDDIRHPIQPTLMQPDPAYMIRHDMQHRAGDGPSTFNSMAMLSEPSLQEVRQNVQRPLNDAQLSVLNQTATTDPGADLREFVNALDDFVPVIPDSVTQYYMGKAGVSNCDPRIVRLISLATQKFVSDIALDCMQQARMKGLGVGPSKKASSNKDVKYTLTNEILDPVLKEYGMKISRAPYFH